MKRRLSLASRLAIIGLGALVFAPSVPANACFRRPRHPKSSAVYSAEYKLRSGQYAKAATAAREAFPGIDRFDPTKAKAPRGWHARRGHYLKLRALKVVAAATIRGNGLTGNNAYTSAARAARNKRVAWAVSKLRAFVKKSRYDYKAKAYLAEGLVTLGKDKDALVLFKQLFKRNRLYDAHSLASLARLLDNKGEVALRDRVTTKCYSRSGSQACPVFRKGTI